MSMAQEVHQTSTRSAEELHIQLAKFGVFTAALLKIQAVRDVTPCRLVNDYGRFDASYFPNLQG